MKRPAFQFYPADWRKDAALQSCSLAAQGLWVNALCIAHECEPYGHLTINGQPMTVAQLARLAGASVREAQALIDELLAAGVASRTEDGALFSRRMVRDEELRQRRVEFGKLGAEHGAKGAQYGAKGAAHGKKGGRPRLHPKPDEAGGNTPVETPGETPPLTPGSTPAPSSSSSSSSSDDFVVTRADAREDDDDPPERSRGEEDRPEDGPEGQLAGKRVRWNPSTVPKQWADWARWWHDTRGVEVAANDVRERKRFVPLANRWIAAGISVGRMAEALEAAERDSTEPIAYLPAYTDRVLASLQTPKTAKAADRAADFMADWFNQDGGTHDDVIDAIPANRALAR